MDWIKCSDRLPHLLEYVLLYAPKLKDDLDGTLIFVGYRGRGNDNEYGSAWGDEWQPWEFDEITHWMPLPEPPKE